MRRLLVLAFLALTGQSALADPYVTCDNGLRCIMAPCPSLNARNLATGETERIAKVDLSRLSLAERRQIARNDATYHGLVVLDGDVRSHRVSSANRAAATVLVVKHLERRSTWWERRQCRSGR